MNSNGKDASFYYGTHFFNFLTIRGNRNIRTKVLQLISIADKFIYKGFTKTTRLITAFAEGKDESDILKIVSSSDEELVTVFIYFSLILWIQMETLL